MDDGRITLMAQQCLDAQPQEERDRIRAWARRIAQGRGSPIVGVGDIRLAMLCAGEEFLPGGEGEE